MNVNAMCVLVLLGLTRFDIRKMMITKSTETVLKNRLLIIILT